MSALGMLLPPVPAMRSAKPKKTLALRCAKGLKAKRTLAIKLALILGVNVILQVNLWLVKTPLLSVSSNFMFFVSGS